jgi:ribosomal protein L35
MQAGIKAVAKRYRTPFTPAMRQARLSRHFYNLHMQQYKRGQSRTCALDKILKKLDSPLPVPQENQRECHIFLKDSQQMIRKLRQTARANRQDFLTRRVDVECGGDNQQAAKIRSSSYLDIVRHEIL